MALSLKIIDKDTGQLLETLPLYDGEAIQVGRRPDFCNSPQILSVIEDDQRISGRHMVISVSGCQIKVKDVGSTNGTFIEGQKYRKGGVSIDQTNHPQNHVLVEVGDRFAFQIEWAEVNEDSLTDTEEPDSLVSNAGSEDELPQTDKSPQDAQAPLDMPRTTVRKEMERGPIIPDPVPEPPAPTSATDYTPLDLDDSNGGGWSDEDW